MRAITVPLDDEQMALVQPAVRELNDAAAAGHPGMLLAQLHPGRMKVFVLDEARALEFAKLLGVGVIHPDPVQ